MNGVFNALSPEGVIWLTIGLGLDALCLVATLLWVPGGLIADIICIIIIGAWMYFRSGTTPEVPVRTRVKAETKAAAKEATVGAERAAGRSVGKTATKTAAKGAGRSVGKKIFVRGGIAFLGTLAGAATIILQLIPFWTITVYWELTHD
ncbi:hypothetical protein AMJ49_04790 [Parcubacteria bacterium DG_74_2]|nr:MAG: hypothetical protein AMJ49_04790 [Parcubacteria bacterium DG_74_2]